MEKRREHTVFYFTEEVDRVLRECDEARAKILTEECIKNRLSNKLEVKGNV